MKPFPPYILSHRRILHRPSRTQRVCPACACRWGSRARPQDVSTGPWGLLGTQRPTTCSCGGGALMFFLGLEKVDFSRLFWRCRNRSCMGAHLQLWPSVVTVTLPARSKRFYETPPEQWGESTILSSGNSIVCYRKLPQKSMILWKKWWLSIALLNYRTVMSSQNMNQSHKTLFFCWTIPLPYQT